MSKWLTGEPRSLVRSIGMFKALLILITLWSPFSLAQQCDWEVLLETYRQSKKDPWENFRLFGPDSSFSNTDFYKTGSLTPELRTMAQMYLGANIMKSATEDSTFAFAVEVERVAGTPASPGVKLEQHHAVTLYIPDPKGGYTVHQAYLVDPEEGEYERRTFHDDVGPARRRK